MRQSRVGFAQMAVAAAVLAMGTIACCPSLSAADDLPAMNREQLAELHLAAEQQLDTARQAVARARAVAAQAQSELERAAAENETLAKAPALEKSTVAAEKAPAGATAEMQTAIEAVRLQIQTLQAERTELLQHKTAEHPLIVDVDVRLQECADKLTELLRDPAASEALPAAKEAESVEFGAPQPSAAEAYAAQRQQAAARLQTALSNWQAADAELRRAVDAEVTATRRLAELSRAVPAPEPVAEATPEPRKIGEIPATVNAATPSAREAAAPIQEHVTPDSDRVGSQPLVLGALVLALVVAAVAAIKLAKAGDDTVFAGADDAAATLALPVMGIIPATPSGLRRTSHAQRLRAMQFLAQLVAAVLVFAAVAYAVQNPATVWEFCTHPGAWFSGAR
jgi:hypothetical protein